MRVYQTKAGQISGTNFHDVRKKAFQIYLSIKKRSKRKPYIRSAYFKKEKIFLDLFWTHLFEKKNFVDLMRRSSRIEPTSKENPNKPGEILHRFTGVTFENELFSVQIKEVESSNKKWLISVFPVDK